MESFNDLKNDIKANILMRFESRILEKENTDFIIKLLEMAKTKDELLKISALGMTYKRMGFHFDARLEKSDNTIKFLKKNKKLSFSQNNAITPPLYK